MKKILLPLVGLLVGLSIPVTARAQAAALLGLFRIGAAAGTSALLRHKPTAAETAAAEKAAADKTAADQAAATANLAATALADRTPLPAPPLQRTPPGQLPKRAAEQVTALESQLDHCHAALLADPKGLVCPPEQRTAIQQAAMSVARAQPSWDLQPYQKEMAFYLAEDARRQRVAAIAGAPVAPANGLSPAPLPAPATPPVPAPALAAPTH